MRRVGGLLLALGLLLGTASGPMAQPTNAASLRICGEVTVYVKATALGTGLLTINGIPMVVALGATLPAAVAVGADICVDLTTSSLGLITGATVTANAHAHVKVCGEITAYTKATATATGLLKINGDSFTLGLGAKLPATVEVGADACLDLEIDGFGRVSDGTVTANAHVHVKVCGEVTAYAKATSTTTGILRLNSRTWTLAVGSSLPASVATGADLCLDLELDGYGRVSDGTASANVAATVQICGTVTSYTAATATALGQLTVAGRAWRTALGADLPASVKAGADLCLDLTLNGFAQVENGRALANIQSTADVCGQVTAYSVASSSTNGSLTIAGIRRTVSPGADVDSRVKAGAYLKLRLALDAFARVARASVLKVGVSAADACSTVTPGPSAGPGQSNEPGPTQNPGESQQPGSTQQPGASQGPSASQAPGGTQQPGASQSPAPGSSHGPGASEEPDATEAPGGDVAGDCVSGVGGLSGGHDGESLLPSTDALGRATTVVAQNAVPLIAIGLLGGIAAWYRSRRRDETSEARA